MIILGVDPGLAATGYGLVVSAGRKVTLIDAGCIKTSPRDESAVRLKIIYDGISSVIVQQSPELLILEDVFMKQAAPRAAISIGQVCGVLLLAASQHGCRVAEIAPRAVKQAITGSGSAEKSQIQRALYRLLGLDEQIKSDHTADALGLAYTGALRYAGKEAS